MVGDLEDVDAHVLTGPCPRLEPRPHLLLRPGLHVTGREQPQAGNLHLQDDARVVDVRSLLLVQGPGWHSGCRVGPQHVPRHTPDGTALTGMGIGHGDRGGLQRSQRPLRPRLRRAQRADERTDDLPAVQQARQAVDVVGVEVGQHHHVHAHHAQP